MLLSNETGAAAHLFTVNLLESEIRACAIVKKTYALSPDGTLVNADDALPLVPDQLVTEFGVFHGELFFRKRGVDICVLGSARFDAPVRHARLRLDVGDWQHELVVMGDRTWTRERADLVPTAPAFFREMKLAYSRAFGGVSQVRGEDVAWPDNPTGCGYYESAEQALGKPLPNILSVHSPAVPRWNTRLPVAGWAPYPNYWGLRASRAVEIDAGSGQVAKIHPDLFNHAHPELVLPRLDPGCPVRVLGLRNKPITFAVPRERPRVRIAVGATTSFADGELDGVFLWTDADRVSVTWRARFHYPVRAEEVRRAALSFVEQ